MNNTERYGAARFCRSVSEWLVSHLKNNTESEKFELLSDELSPLETFFLVPGFRFHSDMILSLLAFVFIDSCELKRLDKNSG